MHADNTRNHLCSRRLLQTQSNKTGPAGRPISRRAKVEKLDIETDRREMTVRTWRQTAVSLYTVRCRQYAVYAQTCSSVNVTALPYKPLYRSLNQQLTSTVQSWRLSWSRRSSVHEVSSVGQTFRIFEASLRGMTSSSSSEAEALSLLECLMLN